MYTIIVDKCYLLLEPTVHSVRRPTIFTPVRSGLWFCGGDVTHFPEYQSGRCVYYRLVNVSMTSWVNRFSEIWPVSIEIVSLQIFYLHRRRLKLFPLEAMFFFSIKLKGLKDKKAKAWAVHVNTLHMSESENLHNVCLYVFPEKPLHMWLADDIIRSIMSFSIVFDF